ncbi:hypothetical protein F2P81_025451 [Scophthalmus maximus]|uniref:Uncharacterized protein n=1 Tax=Scophthalmus maximus TaxID=52904 RepID=A0A6A4RKB3_SCOMX|nr:hypothetical protein F2P81_025451 [Scophthalmus maximus]
MRRTGRAFPLTSVFICSRKMSRPSADQSDTQLKLVQSNPTVNHPIVNHPSVKPVEHTQLVDFVQLQLETFVSFVLRLQRHHWT